MVLLEVYQGLLTQIVTSVQLCASGCPWEDSGYWISLSVAEHPIDTIAISGWVPRRYVVTRTRKTDYFCIDGVDWGTKASRWGHEAKMHANMKPSDVWLQGTLALLPTELFDMLRFFLRVW